jgi:hypothetical protein
MEDLGQRFQGSTGTKRRNFAANQTNSYEITYTLNSPKTKITSKASHRK